MESDVGKKLEERITERSTSLSRPIEGGKPPSMEESYQELILNAYLQRDPRELLKIFTELIQFHYASRKPRKGVSAEENASFVDRAKEYMRNIATKLDHELSGSTTPGEGYITGFLNQSPIFKPA